MGVDDGAVDGGGGGGGCVVVKEEVRWVRFVGWSVRLRWVFFPGRGGKGSGGWEGL